MKKFSNCISKSMITVFLLMVLLSGCVSKDTEQAGKQTAESLEQRIDWLTDIEMGIQKAKETGKPLMIEFMAEWCGPCKKMDDSTFTNPDVVKKSDSFISVRIDVDKQSEVANAYQSNAGKYGGIGIPNVLFLSPDKNILKHPVGYRPPGQFIAIMDSALAVIKE